MKIKCTQTFHACHYAYVPAESADSSGPVFVKLLKYSRWFRLRRAVGFNCAFGRFLQRPSARSNPTARRGRNHFEFFTKRGIEPSANHKYNWSVQLKNGRGYCVRETIPAPGKQMFNRQQTIANGSGIDGTARRSGPCLSRMLTISQRDDCFFAILRRLSCSFPAVSSSIAWFNFARSSSFKSFWLIDMILWTFEPIESGGRQFRPCLRLKISKKFDCDFESNCLSGSKSSRILIRNFHEDSGGTLVHFLDGT